MQRRAAAVEGNSRSSRPTAVAPWSAAGSLPAPTPQPRRSGGDVTVRVLIADDHPMFREGLRAMLAGRDGFDVVAVVGSGREASPLLSSFGPDVAVLDLRMPDGDGITATAGIRQVSPTTRVLVLTSFEGQAEIAGALGGWSPRLPAQISRPRRDRSGRPDRGHRCRSALRPRLRGPGRPHSRHGRPGGATRAERSTAPLDDRFVATVLFSDIVDSTRLAEEQGDTRWTALLDAHDDGRGPRGDPLWRPGRQAHR